MKNHCDRIFHGLYLQRDKNNLAKIAPCCISDKSQSQQLPIDFIKNEYLNKLRHNTKNDIRNVECHMCWKYEDNGNFSKRFEKFSEVDDPELILSLEYNTLPICNAKCIICGPQWSSLWVLDANKLKSKQISNINQLFQESDITEIKYTKFNFDNLNLSQLEYLYFNGGEPLLTDDHIDVLSKIKNLKNLTLSYNTNGSIYPSLQTLEYWNNSKLTKIWFSIDGIEKEFNYIRFPLDWNIVKNNIIKLYNENPNINIGILYTAGIHNIFEIKKTLDFFYNELLQIHPTSAKADRYEFCIQLAVGVFDLKYVGPELRTKILAELESLDIIYKNKIDYIVQYIKNTYEPTVVPWQEYLDNLDQIRSTNWKTIFPRLILD